MSVNGFSSVDSALHRYRSIIEDIVLFIFLFVIYQNGGQYFLEKEFAKNSLLSTLLITHYTYAAK